MALIYEEIEREIATWERFTLCRLGPSARLVSISRFSRNRRIYRVEQKIAKVRKSGFEKEKRANDLAGEYSILKSLKGVSGICQEPEYYKEDEWEILSYDRASGQSFENLLREAAFPRARLLLRLFVIIVRVNFRGIAHRGMKRSTSHTKECGRQ